MEKTFHSSSCQPTPKALRSQPHTLTHAQKLRKLYEIPAPLRTFPLPNFVPHNPLSLVHIVFVWFSQIIKPQISQVTPAYQGWLSIETRSVHVTDTRSIRGLWEQGFYGKGNLSRSEPNWLDAERARRENKAASTSEEITRKRRLERQKLKWERAKKERFVIDQQLLEESGALPSNSIINNTLPLLKAPETDILLVSSEHELKPATSPIELLTFPNLETNIDLIHTRSEQPNNSDTSTLRSSIYLEDKSSISSSPIPTQIEMGITKEKSISNMQKTSVMPLTSFYVQSSSVEIHEVYDDKADRNGTINSIKTPFEHATKNKSSSIVMKALKTLLELCKSVHIFSYVNKERIGSQNPHSSSDPEPRLDENQSFIKIKNEEHLQLTFEEAFFLSYALGCLYVLDPTTKTRISNKSLFSIFRQNSSFPPLTEEILPDNNFLVNYVVYHHFRSLGWVVRSGIKFSVDYLLYNRGPVFSHAEFSVLILPSYSDPYWTSTTFLTEYSQRKQHRTWAWLSCINRVITQVKKTLVLCYVDIPPPLVTRDEEQMSLDILLARYKIREFIFNRFLTNRMRA